MEFREERYNKYNKLLCIGLDNFDLSSFPQIMKNFIYYGLKKEEKVLIFTDDISYEDVEKNFPVLYEYINHNINMGNLRIKVYDPANFSISNENFLDTLEVISLFKNKIRIIWDFKSLTKRISKLEGIINAVDVIFGRLDEEKVKNFIYINNNIYDIKLFKRLSYKFKAIVIFNKEKDVVFGNKSEIAKCVWLLQNNAQLKYQNNNLVLFNDEFSSIPKNFDEEKFKSTIMNKIINLCNVDFCLLYSSLSEKENILGLDSYYGVTKKHKYYIFNDRDIINWTTVINKKILEGSCNTVLLNFSELEDESMKNIFKKINIKSCIGIYVEYYQNIKGVICLGRYLDQKAISKEDLEYIESICKAAFFLIQEQKNFLNLQNRLIQNEKLRAMGEMAAGITHDLNNVLTPIIGSVQMLKENIEDKNIIKQLDIIEMCANDGMNITSKVKKITRNYNNKEEWEEFDIDKLILDSIELTKDKWMRQSALNGINVKVIPQLKSSAKTRGNITEIREVFINIISNAIDSMPNGGKIEIISKNSGKNIQIEIRDNGLGMNKEIMKRIFEPFFTTKGSKGSGLGLSVSYKIIQSHFGDIKIESEENVGTSFQITLPICESKVVEKIVGSNGYINVEDEKINFCGNVLVIDDQERVRKVVSDMIKSITDCKLKNCSGDNIDNELKRRKYDIILCDFSMPNIDGIQVAKRVKELNGDAYFCLMTGWVGSFDKSKLENIDFILNKPISKKKLKEMFVKYKIKVNK